MPLKIKSSLLFKSVSINCEQSHKEGYQYNDTRTDVFLKWSRIPTTAEEEILDKKFKTEI